MDLKSLSPGKVNRYLMMMMYIIARPLEKYFRTVVKHGCNLLLSVGNTLNVRSMLES